MDSSRKLKVIVQGLVEGTNVRGKPSRTWLDDISDWGGEDVIISKEGTRSSAVGNYNKKAMKSPQLKNVEDIKNRRIGHQRELPRCNDDDENSTHNSA